MLSVYFVSHPTLTMMHLCITQCTYWTPLEIHYHHHNPWAQSPYVGVQCPISSSLDEFSSYWDWLRCPGLTSVLVSIALPFAFHILGVFHSLLSAIGFRSCLFFTADVSPPILSALHLLTF